MSEGGSSMARMSPNGANVPECREMFSMSKLRLAESFINYGACSVCREEQIGKRHEHPCE